MADDTENTDVPEEILNAGTAVAQSKTIVLVKDRLPATLFMGTDTDVDIPVEYSVDGGVSFVPFVPAQVLSNSVNSISIYAPMTLRLNKPITTTDPVKAYLQYRRP